jgi:hypothetical protein
MDPRKLFLIASTLLLLTSGPSAAHDAEKLGNVSFPISCAAEAQPAFAGAARAAEAAGNRQKATEYYKKLLVLTAKADPENKEVKEAQAFLAAR